MQTRLQETEASTYDPTHPSREQAPALSRHPGPNLPHSSAPRSQVRIRGPPTLMAQPLAQSGRAFLTPSLPSRGPPAVPRRCPPRPLASPLPCLGTVPEPHHLLPPTVPGTLAPSPRCLHWPPKLQGCPARSCPLVPPGSTSLQQGARRCHSPITRSCARGDSCVYEPQYLRASLAQALRPSPSQELLQSGTLEEEGPHSPLTKATSTALASEDGRSQSSTSKRSRATARVAGRARIPEQMAPTVVPWAERSYM